MGIILKYTFCYSFFLSKTYLCNLIFFSWIRESLYILVFISCHNIVCSWDLLTCNCLFILVGLNLVSAFNILLFSPLLLFVFWCAVKHVTNIYKVKVIRLWVKAQGALFTVQTISLKMCCLPNMWQVCAKCSGYKGDSGLCSQGSYVLVNYKLSCGHRTSISSINFKTPAFIVCQAFFLNSWFSAASLLLEVGVYLNFQDWTNTFYILKAIAY